MHKTAPLARAIAVLSGHDTHCDRTIGGGFAATMHSDMSGSGKLPPLLPAKVRRLTRATLTSSGVTSSELRQAIEARAATFAGADRPVTKLPEELASYVDKVAKYAHKVTDEDIEKLKSLGYSEDAIFEVTVTAALGAGLGRLERGMSILMETAEAKPGK